MFPVVLETLVVGTPPAASMVVLRPKEDTDRDGRVLPIWIGVHEAASIGIALHGQKRERPMTHDLLTNVLKACGATLESVVISRVEGTIFYAVLVIDHCGQMETVDARPSDAIALAVRMHVPLYVEEEVMDLASLPASWQPSGEAVIEAEEFHNFVENLSPEDFL